MISVKVVITEVCNNKLSWQCSPGSVHGTGGAHFEVKCGALRACLALLWQNLGIDLESIFLNLSSGLDTAWLSKWTMHLTSQPFSWIWCRSFSPVVQQTQTSLYTSVNPVCSTSCFLASSSRHNHCMIMPCAGGRRMIAKRHTPTPSVLTKLQIIMQLHSLPSR